MDDSGMCDTDSSWHSPQCEATRVGLALRRTPAGYRFMSRFLMSDLDLIGRVADAAASVAPHSAAVHVHTRVVRALQDEALLTSELFQRQFADLYAYALASGLPGRAAYLKVSRRLADYTSNWSLDRIELARMAELDVLAAKDSAAAVLRNAVTTALERAAVAPDDDLAAKLSQAFEAFAEAWVYRHFRDSMSIRKLVEDGDSIPDFECELDGRKFFIEVKSPDITDGETHHRKLMKEATKGEIEIDSKLREVRNRHGIVGVFARTRFIGPYDRAYGPEEDAFDVSVPILVYRKRIRDLFRSPQFTRGPTFGLMVVDRLSAGGRETILPEVSRTVGISSRMQSKPGIVWQAAFGKSGTKLQNFHTRRTYVLRGAPALRDKAAPFPGVGLLILENKGDAVSECYGLLDRTGHLPVDWSIDDSKRVLDGLCDVWNDDGDNRLKWDEHW